ncbi:carbohydrate ABC transporter substrate-binding protein (CUT1 family) [Anaerobacterium chartisolvens]|uniref:Carbohydrate ABC transporter substrate-binding protein (CUT1 family) n=1 Tax=Anaerobacterium chartisolvens TaxID=1297424 RepID=A0A369BAG8_9FIRM|nr:extracellular solute-binding protein [Anaerobacterium chartisolvens]RCX17517.1 carbohydrate ABC transporter substrate-binding protein (CUT1 family) [Anaerobacterium chartisolvens]
MIRVKWKGAVSAVVSAALVISVLSGCGQKNEGAQSSTPSDQTQQTAVSNGITEKPIKISMFLQDSADQAISPDLPIIKEITQKTNVSFDFIPGPNTEDQFREKFNVTIASGSIPDVVVSPYRDDMFKVAEQGIFEPLDRHVEKSAPNLKAILDSDPNIIKSLRSTDGQNYFLPFLGAVRTFKVWMVREDWLQKLNLQKPETLDDWYNMLKAFKEQDPNGNGKPDEIPYTTRNTKAGVLAFMEAYGISGFEANEQFFIEDNTVKYAYTDPRCKEALTYIRKLYAEGLIDPEYATNDTKVWLSRITNEVSGACQDTCARAYSLGTQIKAANPASSASMVVVPPPKGPTGTQMTTSQMQPVRGFTAISVKSKYKEEIVKLFDYFYGEEGSLMMNFGIEGQTYDMVSGKPQYTDAIMKDPQGRSILSMLNVYGHREWAYKQDIGYEDALMDDKYVKYRNDMEQYIRPTIPALSFTEEERDIINSKYTEIQTYKDEMIDKFIMGKEPLEKFDEFVSKIKSMGIEDVLKVEQAAYDRYNK